MSIGCRRIFSAFLGVYNSSMYPKNFLITRFGDVWFPVDNDKVLLLDVKSRNTLEWQIYLLYLIHLVFLNSIKSLRCTSLIPKCPCFIHPLLCCKVPSNRILYGILPSEDNCFQSSIFIYSAVPMKLRNSSEPNNTMSFSSDSRSPSLREANTTNVKGLQPRHPQNAAVTELRKVEATKWKWRLRAEEEGVSDENVQYTQEERCAEGTQFSVWRRGWCEAHLEEMSFQSTKESRERLLCYD